ncbi:hypothetical protein DZB84_06925 [Bacillus sp. HNG]|nr:hypothetical protein DZB84_06925 [Bacillus sp. HNG]
MPIPNLYETLPNKPRETCRVMIIFFRIITETFAYVLLGYAFVYELFVTSVVNKGRVSDNRGKRVFIFFRFYFCKTKPIFQGNLDFFG